MKDSEIQFLTDRDTLILNFLWKWKLSTTAALAKRFFPLCAEKTSYLRLRLLEKGGFIKSQSDLYGKKFVWTLAPKGYGVVKTFLPKLVSDGYSSESVGHDLLSAAFQLGDWLGGEPIGAELFSEQQLRRLHPDVFSSWVPKSQTHRPDGYSLIRVDGKNRILAFEVEINRKRPVEYELIGDRYCDMNTITRVLWLVARPSMAKNIQAAIVKGIRGKPFIHNFISISEFVKHGWQTPIELGPEQGKPIAFLMNQPIGTVSNPDCSQFLLNVRKSPHKSMPSLLYSVGDFRDRLGSTPSPALSSEEPSYV